MTLLSILITYAKTKIQDNKVEKTFFSKYVIIYIQKIGKPMILKI